MRGVVYQWGLEGKSWKLPLLARLAAGVFSAKPSTPYGSGTLHDFMHAKVTVVDDTIFLGSFNLSRSGERNAENVLELEDAALATELAGFVDAVRSRYPRLTI
jgi:phosphatidylserine/phosphatidylglycerophosphate/cardiolipin synthase-like enzyme